MIDKQLLNLPSAKHMVAICATCALFDALLCIGQAISLAYALDMFWQGYTLAQTVWLVILFLACFTMRHIIIFARNRALDTFAQKQASDLRKQLLEHLYDYGPTCVQTQGTGSMVSMLVEGISKVREYITIAFPKTIDLMIVPAILAVALCCIDWISGIIAIVILPCIFGYMVLLGGNARLAAQKQHGEYVRLANHFIDTLRGMSTLASFGRTTTYGNTVYSKSEDLRQATIKTLRSATLSSLVLDLFRTFAVAAVAIMLGLRLMAGDISLAPALMALILIPEYFTVVRRYAADFHATLDGQNNLAAICDFLQSKAPGVQSDFDLQQELTTLTLNNVYYRYDNEDHNALRDINLQIKAPMKVGIIGTSGSGKSSLAHLLAGFAQPSAGNINVNGNNIYSLDASWWQRKVAYIPQNPHIFSATLRENVSFYNTDATDEAILEALRIVGLDELDQLDLNTPIGEGGRALSGGQTQRVALARMLLDPQRTIWVLDEPSAHLDVETELDLKLRMLPLFENKLVFFATHRLHWMRDMDTILVLDHGCIVQIGTYKELTACKDGTFAKLLATCKGGADCEGGNEENVARSHVNEQDGAEEGALA